MENTNSLNGFVIDDTSYITSISTKYKNRKKYSPVNPNNIIAHLPGTIREIFVKIGDRVRIGDKLLVFEAMKMKNLIKSDIEGEIKTINIQSGQMVSKNYVMIELN